MDSPWFADGEAEKLTSRDQAGNLTYFRGDQGIEVIRGLPGINVISDAEETLQEVLLDFTPPGH